MLPHLGIFPVLAPNSVLTIVAKSFVMALLYISHPMPVADLEAWVRPNGRRCAKEGLREADLILSQGAR